MPRSKAAPKRLSDQVRQRSKTPIDHERSDDVIPEHINPKTLIPTGSTMMDLAMSDRIEGGYQMGRIDLLVGDSDTGKTMLVLTGFAEATRRKRFDDYRMILDCVETNSGINISGLLGHRASARIEPPRIDDDGEPVYSNTIQDLQDNITAALEDGHPFLYALDSWDALTSKEELEKLEKQRKARAMGREAAGHMGAEKAKAASQILRVIKKGLKHSNSHLIIIFQTRDNIGAMPFEEKRVYSGGRAPKFYSQHEVWLGARGKHRDKKTDLEIGVKTKIRQKKNHLTGKKREAEFDIFYDYGVDDLGSCLDFLVDQGVIRKAGGRLDPKELWGFDKTYYRADLLRELEERDLEKEIRQKVQEVWTALENSLKLGRKPRF